MKPVEGPVHNHRCFALSGHQELEVNLNEEHGQRVIKEEGAQISCLAQVSVPLYSSCITSSEAFDCLPPPLFSHLRNGDNMNTIDLVGSSILFDNAGQVAARGNAIC